MKRPLKDVSKSVHTRLLNLAKESGRPFADLFRLYAMERFLYRLSRSAHAQKFVLKGGLMLRVWDASSLRPTKDVDLLGRTENSIENLEAIVREICALNFEPDGITFDPESVGAALIKEDAEYNGVRVKFVGHVGSAEARMQLDVGFGDAVVPAPTEIDLPTLLDQPAPHLRAYQRETTIAEKVHAMTVLGTLNGRMKDFYDLWFLSQRFAFDGSLLRRAIEATFAARSTAIEAAPVALSGTFAREAEARWSAFLRKSGLGDVSNDLGEVIARLRDFLGPVLATTPFAEHWNPGGPWTNRT